MKKLLLLLVVLAVGAYEFLLGDGELVPPLVDEQTRSQAVANNREVIQAESQQPVADYRINQQIQQAFRNQQSDLQIEGSGIVDRILPDDDNGDRHQRFILEIGNGQTLLVAHNIDLAPRIESLSEGDEVQFYGEYEWNQQGGVMHWTHHDPGGRHEDGWLQHNGRIYQ